MRVAGCALILGLVLSGCGIFKDREHTPHITAARDSSGKCEGLLSKVDAEALIGTDLDDPQNVSIDDVSMCGWNQADNEGRLAAGSIEATEWAKSLPGALALIKQRYPKVIKPERLRIAERQLAKGLPKTNAEACSMFRIMVSLQYPNLEDGSDTVVSFVPDTKHPTAITAQSCSGGRFRTLVWTRTSGVPSTDELSDKFLDAVIALD